MLLGYYGGGIVYGNGSCNLIFSYICVSYLPLACLHHVAILDAVGLGRPLDVELALQTAGSTKAL